MKINRRGFSSTTSPSSPSSSSSVDPDSDMGRGEFSDGKVRDTGDSGSSFSGTGSERRGGETFRGEVGERGDNGRAFSDTTSSSSFPASPNVNPALETVGCETSGGETGDNGNGFSNTTSTLDPSDVEAFPESESEVD